MKNLVILYFILLFGILSIKRANGQALADSLVTVGGTIWFSEDGSYTFENFDPIVSNVALKIYTINGVLVDSILSNVDGSYEFDSLISGKYFITIENSNFTEGSLIGLLSCLGNGGDDDVDNDDNGFGDNTVQTNIIDLTFGKEPDGNGSKNYTIDFCFENRCMLQHPKMAATCLLADTFCSINDFNFNCSRMLSPPLIGDAPNPLCFRGTPGGAPHNMTWFAFVAGTGNYTLHVEFFGCVGGQSSAQFGIFQFDENPCDFSTRNEIVCHGGQCVTGAVYIPSDLFIPGQVYYFWIDGCAGSICSFSILTIGDYKPYTPPLNTQISSIINDPILNGIMSVKTDDAAKLQHTWMITDPDSIITNVKTNGNLLEFILNKVGNYRVTLLSNFNNCDTSVIENEHFDFYCRDPKVDLLKIMLFADVNANGLFDSTDYPLSNGHVKINEFISLTGLNGETSGNVGIGINNIYVTMPYGNWVNSGYNGTVTIIDTQKVKLSIPFIPVVTPNSGILSVSGPPFRCNTDIYISSNFYNTGGKLLDATFVMIPDEKLSYTFSPNFTNSDSLGYYWHIDSLLPGKKFTTKSNFSIPDALLGDTLRFKYFVIDNNNDTIDSFFINEVVRCAFDPNDKLTHPDRLGKENYTLFDENIVYTIRFQNTGNDTAFYVKIIDREFQFYFDLNSLIVLESSHKVKTSFNSNFDLEFEFENIVLPDSTTNYSLSQGYVSFTAKSLRDFPENFQIFNSAAIIFDKNPPIFTNVVKNTLVSKLPCPSDVITLKENYLYSVGIGNNYKWYDCSTNEAIANENDQIFYPKESGSYYVKVTGDFCTIQSNCIDFISTITKDEIGNYLVYYPSPTIDILKLESNLEIEYVEVFDFLNQKLISNHSYSGQSLIEEINVSNLNFGIYLLKVKTKGGRIFFNNFLKG